MEPLQTSIGLFFFPLQAGLRYMYISGIVIIGGVTVTNGMHMEPEWSGGTTKALIKN